MLKTVAANLTGNNPGVSYIFNLTLWVGGGGGWVKKLSYPGGGWTPQSKRDNTIIF